MNDIINKKIKLVAVYGRVSTSLQEEQETIQSQLLQIQKFVKEHEYSIVREYLDDGWSGGELARPALDELRIDAKKHGWDAVLVHDPDRLAREFYLQEVVRNELSQLGIPILFVTVPPIKDINDKMMAGFRGLFAEYERAKISERFRMGKISRINLGHVLTTEAPYGYTYVPNTGKRGMKEYVVGHYEINEDEAEVVRMIFGWVADDGMTLRAVVRKLKEYGILPRKSKRGVWNTSTLSTLLRSQVYIGKARWGASYAVLPEKPLKEVKYKKKTSRRMRPEKDWLFVDVPPILNDPEIFYRAGKQLRDNFATMTRNKKNDYLLAGKIWCICGHRRTGEGPQHGKHLYYRCTDRVYSFPLPRTCFEGGINARIADDMVWQQLNRTLSDPELMSAQFERWMSECNNGSVKESSLDVEHIKKQIVRLKAQEEKFIKAYSADVITLDQLKEHVEPIKETVTSLEKNLAQNTIEQKVEIEMEKPATEDLDVFAKEALGILGALKFNAKKAIVNRTIEKIISTQKDLQVYGFINLQQIYVEFFTENRHRGSSKRGEVHSFQSAHQESGGYQ